MDLRKLALASTAVLVAPGAMDVTASQSSRGAWIAESDQAGAGFASEVASAGDVNGDGYADILVAAYHYTDAFDQEGGAFLFLGSSEGPSKAPDWSVAGGQESANLGSVASAGDVNGDGFDDVVVGTNGWDNHVGRAQLFLGSRLGLAPDAAWTAQPGDRDFGMSVASAGDVNGDGFEDVIVGAPGFTNDQTSEGRVHVYLGSPAGLGASAAWSVEGNQAVSRFGGSVASAGDVNGDGFDDVVVGAGFWNAGQNDEGRAFVYLGSPSGLATTPAWIAESNQAGALFGMWVGSAGDVNGDGFSDVVVSANTYTGGLPSEGAAFVYLGGPSGLATAPAWIGASGQSVALAGAVSSGDFDGDGYDDVLVGSYSYDHPQRNEGAVFVYLGSAAGLSPLPRRLYDSDQRDSMFGFAAAFAGDVNGDGYQDVLVGAYTFDGGQPNEGRAFVFPGARLSRK